MKRILSFVIIGLVVITVGYFVIKHIVRSATEKRATLMLAEIVCNYDDEYGEMAAKALIEMKPGNILTKLEEGLDGGNSGCKVRIAQVLDAIEGESTTDLLIVAFGDDDIRVSSTAALGLARRHMPEVLEVAKDRLSDDDPVVAGINYEVVANFEDDIVAQIERELNDTTFERQPYVLRGLIPAIEHGNERPWNLLKRGISSGFPEVRTASFNAAISLGGEYRAEALLTGVESSDAELRHRALREITDGDDTARFTDTLKMALNGIDPRVVLNASWGLLKLRDPEPVPKLRSILRDDEVTPEDKIIAARILARMGAPDGADPMYDILDSPTISEEIKLGAAEVLGEYDDIKGMSFLGEAIKPGKPREIRMKALIQLGVMGDKNASTLLLEMTSDPDEAVAVRAAYALTALNDRRGIGRLKRFLRSDSIEVRTIAAVGIITGGNIGDIIGDEGFG